MKLLINRENKKLYPDTIKNDLNTSEGVISSKDYNSKSEIISTHTGKKLLCLSPDFKDLFFSLKRGPQIITLKDAYFIASQLGLMKGSYVLDCGGGSGAATCVFANIVGDKGKVVSVEKEKRFINVINSNVELFGFKNIEVVETDLKDYSSRKKFDAMNLDLPNPWDYISCIDNLLKNGARLTVYVPNTTQLTMMSEKCKDTNIVLQNVYELIMREWDVKGLVCHPKFQILGHTGFIMSFRRISGV